jgi:hypothetical protein
LQLLRSVDICGTDAVIAAAQASASAHDRLGCIVRIDNPPIRASENETVSDTRRASEQFRERAIFDEACFAIH